jgi:hypothetical protein
MITMFYDTTMKSNVHCRHIMNSVDNSELHSVMWRPQTVLDWCQESL